MGYTMAYTQTRDLTPEEWAELRTMLVSILGHFKKDVTVPYDIVEWSMDDDVLKINGKGEDFSCEEFRFFREPVAYPCPDSRQMTQKVHQMLVDFYCKGPGGKYDSDSEGGQHVAHLWRLYNPGTAETPWFCNMVKTRSRPYDLVGKAVLAVLYTRFPGSVIVADECEGELTCSAEEAWTVGVEYATKALPAHAFVPNLGRYFPKRMWDKVRRYVFTVQPAVRACQLRAAATAYAHGAPAVDALKAEFERNAKSIKRHETDCP